MNFVTLVTTGLVALTVAAKPTIKPSSRKPANDSAQDRLANSVFLNFLNCGRTPAAAKGEDDVLRCAKQFLASTVGPTRAHSYLQSFAYPSEYSETYPCDEATTKLIKAFDEKDFDFARCFDTNLVDPPRPGVVYFRLERGMPKISRLKL